MAQRTSSVHLTTIGLVLAATSLGAQQAPSTPMEPLVVFGKPSETQGALTPTLRARTRIVSVDALSPLAVDSNGRVPNFQSLPSMPAPGPNDSHILLVRPADYRAVLARLRDHRLTPLRYQSLLPANLQLSRGRQCPTCLPIEPASNVLRPGVPGLSTARFNACRDSARSLRQVVPQHLPCFIQGACTDALPPTAIGDYDKYTQTCLVAPQQLSGGTSLAVSQTVSKELASFAVLTREGDTTPFCGALILGAQTAVTVAHCFSGPIEPAQMVLRAYSTPDIARPFTISTRPPQPWAEWLSDRPIVLDLATPIAGLSAEACFDDPSPNEPLDLFGYVRDSLADTNAQWTSSVRTGAYTCSATGSFDPTSHCFAHTCQAFPGFSGAPIFAVPRPGASCTVRIVGMQKSGAGDPGDFCGGPNSNGAFTGSTLTIPVNPGTPRHF